jgi:hypothetical protein
MEKWGRIQPGSWSNLAWQERSTKLSATTEHSACSTCRFERTTPKSNPIADEHVVSSLDVWPRMTLTSTIKVIRTRLVGCRSLHSSDYFKPYSNPLINCWVNATAVLGVIGGHRIPISRERFIAKRRDMRNRNQRPRFPMGFRWTLWRYLTPFCLHPHGAPMHKTTHDSRENRKSSEIGVNLFGRYLRNRWTHNHQIW